ncbi:heavy metal translocating P-type ATPase [Oxalobacteraceae bacterium R-40]|uniref:Heavy metal translocating P-type ATPase n=1 Tax=Keguizhuia sedimenti TaxID=3064264 RepID=A0ABU1BND9_9BURK|nr:heavy metal translocating P-type ATPase [Oxalobacteraceae bacterium R-40]
MALNPAGVDFASQTLAGDEAGCFHCGLPLPQDAHWSVLIDDTQRQMCCPGCEAVAKAIVDSGFSDYYRTRSAFAATADGSSLVPDELKLYDTPESAQQFSSGENACEALLSVEGIRCAACVWLIERRLAQVQGVHSAHLNVATERLTVRWDKAACKPSTIFETLRQLGYAAYPFDAARHGELLRKSSRTLGRRLFVAGLSMMQVMMYAVPAYMGDSVDMEADMAALMRWASLLLTIPAVFYSAQPFFKGAWTNLKNRALGMDVPVALGILAAFIGSTVATLQGQGEVYFDTVTMFVFLLLCSRYLELNARRNAADALEKLQHGLPASALRLAAYPGSRDTELVATTMLREGDYILVKPGEAVASDGLIVEGSTAVDLSLLTGESEPQRRSAGDILPGGAVNATQAIVMRVTTSASNSTLAALIRLVEGAGASKPQLALWADKVAAWFVAALLLFAVLVFGAWQWFDPARAWPTAIAVLVVSCPCALSLATPTALATAMDRLAKDGILVVKSHVLETLHRASHVIFDKTGTLTLGRPAVENVAVFGDLSAEDALQLAAAMESSNAHPIAAAIANAAREKHSGPQFAQEQPEVVHTAGKGLEAQLEGIRYRLGSASFVQELTGTPCPGQAIEGKTPVYLANKDKWLARFDLADSLRADAQEVVRYFQAAGKKVILLSGDQQTAVRHLADRLGVQEAHGEYLPEQKLAFVQDLQAGGAVVAMVGDGINDAAVLHAADVSFAMGTGAALAQVHADTVLLSERLLSIRETAVTAAHTMAVIRQNLAWATLYNIVAIPAAAIGLLNPWLSAVGMSLSSAIVVINAMRLRRPAKLARRSKETATMRRDARYQPG